MVCMAFYAYARHRIHSQPFRGSCAEPRVGSCPIGKAPFTIKAEPKRLGHSRAENLIIRSHLGEGFIGLSDNLDFLYYVRYSPCCESNAKGEQWIYESTYWQDLAGQFFLELRWFGRGLGATTKDKELVTPVAVQCHGALRKVRTKNDPSFSHGNLVRLLQN